MQNKNKISYLDSKPANSSVFKKKQAKGIANLLLISLTAKVLIIGALFLFPQKFAIAESNELNSQTLITLTNAQRQLYNLPKLTISPVLTEAATRKANNLLENHYFSHTSPEGKPFYKWIKEVGYEYQSAGENLAISFEKSENVVAAWMNSPTHRSNILDDGYSEIGIAVVTGKFLGEETAVIVQMFGEPLVQMYNSEATKAEPAALGERAAGLPHPATTFHFIMKINSLLTFIILILLTMLAIIIAQHFAFRSFSFSTHSPFIHRKQF